ncbi:YeiH family protein [Sulfurospirillum halorespirans]|uniref:Membrane protein n=1 Tax=Sulfurospirillum halorespirans DSM 13726 TaxID=1193502 RepID=A0A1D7TGL2_9BACT|nr:YeiH family protein [Sulfurospirillum halorespirans]AOO64129.1 membrane protein [Sulfurospirillum halorespirans DSM 13726]
MFQKENRTNTLSGILLVALFAMSATYLAEFSLFQRLGISPLIIGIVLGMIYANTLRTKFPKEWVSGIQFCTKTILRVGIVLYGFRITFQNIEAVGLAGIATSGLVVSSTFIIGYFVGTRWLKLDKETTILTSAGSSICGAAAVLATEPVLNAEPYKSAIAVSTVVVFGTLAMFFYPFAYKFGVIPFTPEQMGIYIGGTLHEVAHVVAAGNAVGVEASKTAVIVKMIRVMMLAPFLVILGFWLVQTSHAVSQKQKKKITIPWFAVFFIVVAGFNSLNLVPLNAVATINAIDTFLLTMAMSALGMETSIDKFKHVGMKPIYLASILFAWLTVGGFYIVKFSLML